MGLFKNIRMVFVSCLERRE